MAVLLYTSQIVVRYKLLH